LWVDSRKTPTPEVTAVDPTKETTLTDDDIATVWPGEAPRASVGDDTDTVDQKADQTDDTDTSDAGDDTDTTDAQDADATDTADSDGTDTADQTDAQDADGTDSGDTDGTDS